MKADRLVSLLLLLQSAPRRTARELAGRLEVCQRTIYRDVDALCASGVPVFTERGVDGGIALADGYRRALLNFGDEEIRALFVSGSAILTDLGLGASFERALEKLRGGLGDVQRRAAEHARKRIHIDQRRWNQADPPLEKLALLRRAVWDDRRVDLRYEDRRRAVSMRSADPFGLVSKAGVWYLIARTADGMRSFRVDRILEVNERADRFERPAAFDVEAYWRETAAKMLEGQPRDYPVVMLADRDALEQLNGYCPCDILDEREGLLLRGGFSGKEAALRFCVAWGGRIRLIEPSELAEAIVEYAKELQATYAAAALA